jgi:hypothetical protein
MAANELSKVLVPHVSSATVFDHKRTTLCARLISPGWVAFRRRDTRFIRAPVHLARTWALFYNSTDASQEFSTSDVAMDFDFVEWDREDDPRGNTQHIADNGLSIDEVEDVIHDPRSRPVQSPSSRRPALIGQTSTGKTIIVIV